MREASWHSTTVSLVLIAARGGDFPGREVPCPAWELDSVCLKDVSARGRKACMAAAQYGFGRGGFGRGYGGYGGGFGRGFGGYGRGF
ncbi:hypothetical protein MRX96_039735 [Rhipicephalus microplus]